MTTEKTNDLKAIAERVKKLGAELMGSHAAEELREVWRRLRNVNGSPPKGAKPLAERVALYLIELGDEAPGDLREFVAGTEPLRDFGPLSKSTTREEPQGSATEAQAQEGAKTEADATAGAEPAADAAASPTETNEDTTVHTHTETGRKGRRAGPPPAAPKSKGKKAKQAKAAAAPRDAGGKKAAASRPPRGSGPREGAAASRPPRGSGPREGAAASRPPRGSGPREGTICALVIQHTKDGKSAEQTAKLVAKAFPGTEFQKKADKGDNSLVAWYRNYARNKGWLPRSGD